MGSRGSAATVALVLLCSAVSSVFCTLEDGLPRPPNFADAPTASYGPDPVVLDSGIPAACDWYGFVNTLYDASTGASCLSVLRLALTNATVNPPEKLQPYTLYTLARLIDPANNQSYCYQGCYNLATSQAPLPDGDPLAPSPSGDPLAPPPHDDPSAPSPDGDPLAPPPSGDPLAPPPLDFPGPPPPLSEAPSPLPNGDPLSPPPTQFTPAGPVPLAAPPVGDTFPVLQPVPSPPGLAPTPGEATPDATPPIFSPPSPPLPTVPTSIHLNDGGSLVAPGSALLSLFAAGVALILTLTAF